MTKVTLANIGSIIDATTAQTTLNSNNAAIVTAVENTLSRDGTAPNTMLAPLDMNSNAILNLPAPVNNSEPLRLQDVALINSGGIISSNPLPVAGTTGQVLTKTSAVNYATNWQTPSFSLGVGQVLGSNVAINTIDNSNLVTAAATSIKGNPTNVGSNVQDFTITGLIASAAPDAANDTLLINDSATGTFKKVTPTALIGSTVAGVQTIDAQSGIFTTGNGLTSPSKVIGLSAARRTLPTRQTFTSGSGTYTTPANCLRISVRMVGGGGGGGANGGAGISSAGGGGQTIFNSIIANGGVAGNATSTAAGGAGGLGGTAGAGTASYRTSGEVGGQGLPVAASFATAFGNTGGSSLLGKGGNISSGIAVGPGGGGGGAANVSSTFANAGGGGGGEYVELNINTPAATYAYTVGPAGTAGGAGAGGNAGAIGSTGVIIVDEYYGS